MQYLKIPIGIALKIGIGLHGGKNAEFCKFADIAESTLSNVIRGRSKMPERLISIMSAWACYDLSRFVVDEDT